ncbi:MAG: TM2 domain-containing protein [Prevotella sp.]|uniref:TM2 domain-containing protein n=1 Tax=Prevotella sp. TaxID=59823 RepID=UPI002A292D31|nr:TM2 domain-containing protein [Prevotella sp.]MDD7317303.1 TM2 domain-containing protein [Prevotellaceae bacterium]MDY4019907.1 TM2 domain-containing protein [Prevotella sp.]
MNSNKVSAFLITNQGNISSEYIPIIRQRLEQLDDNRSFALMSVSMKSPFVALLLSIFLGSLGIDRFYIGDNTNGAIKLIVGLVILPIVSVLTLGIGSLLYIGYVLDWFLIMGATKKKNAEKVMLYL